ncbi:MAG: lipopolysaccharide/colanic/teichoic acid biosynthesis glycosyltransferase [Cyclobacteriaceae bacterium]|jgi:lipopolysaccharide/colanic/teichoic acid biosynthesis glycosyltransferase
MTCTEILLINTPLNAGKILNNGFQPTIYDDVQSAISGLKHRADKGKQMPALIISGFNQLDFSFNELTGWLAGLNTKIPVILCEDKIDDFLIQEANENKVIDVITPDINADVLKKKLEVIIGKTSILKPSSTTRKPLNISKRMFDIVLSGTLLLMLSPLFLIVIIAIKLESKGAAFYWQKRVGTGYKVFNFFKFRSMSVDADSMVDQLMKKNHYGTVQQGDVINDIVDNSTFLFDDQGSISETKYLDKKVADNKQSFFKVQDDPRITKVGHFIRKTSIDELPQLLNVLIGDMSIVGNRPLPLYEAEKLTDDLWMERFMAPSGITGLWQVTERGKAKTSEDSRKLLDIEYARTHTFWSDLKILIKTPLAALQQENV